MSSLALLVHGAWHSAACWGRTQLALAARGVASVAIDLPGLGLDARLPASFSTPDQAGFDTEPSPLAHDTLEQYVEAIVEAIVALREHDVTLAVLGDPEQLGVFRINPLSPDPAYVETLRAGYYSDLPEESFLPWRRMLMQDFPVAVGGTPAVVTPQRWGRVPRTYVHCADDRVATLALQQRWVRDTDDAAPEHPFTVRHLPTGHVPFATAPEALADIVAGVAGR